MTGQTHLEIHGAAYLLSEVEVRLNTIKNSVRTAKKTQHFTVTKINWLTLFKVIIAVYCENHMTHMNTKLRLTDCWKQVG
jgi:hypothetical protein